VPFVIYGKLGLSNVCFTEVKQNKEIETELKAVSIRHFDYCDLPVCHLLTSHPI